MRLANPVLAFRLRRRAEVAAVVVVGARRPFSSLVSSMVPGVRTDRVLPTAWCGDGYDAFGGLGCGGADSDPVGGDEPDFRDGAP